MAKILDIKVGDKFGRLTVLERAGIGSNGHRMYLCLCECGNKKELKGASIHKGTARSCGCLRKGPKKNPRRPKTERGEVGLRTKMSSYRIHANKRGISFDLTEEEFRELTQKNCYYCGVAPNMIAKGSMTSKNEDTRKNAEYVYNGVDRIDSSKGYSVENCVPCCRGCNVAKWDYTTEEFFALVKRIYEYQNLD